MDILERGRYIFREPVSARQSKLARFLAQEGINGNTVLSHVRHGTVGEGVQNSVSFYENDTDF